jgi:hypothetical protein
LSLTRSAEQRSTRAGKYARVGDGSHVPPSRRRARLGVALLVVYIPSLFVLAALGYLFWSAAILGTVLGGWFIAVLLGSRSATRGLERFDERSDRVVQRVRSMSRVRQALLLIVIFVVVLAIVST